MKIKKGDSVMVISGAHKGQTGKVTETQPDRGLVIVSGVNVHIRHEKPSHSNQNRGGIIKQEAPLPISNVAAVRPGDSKKTTRIGYQITDKGKKIRVARQAKNKEIK